MERKAVKKIRDELSKWHEIKDILKNEDLDAETLVDTLDGETELMEALCLVGESILEDQIQIDGLSAAIDKLSSRLHRFKTSTETKRNIILQAMDIAGIPTVKGPLFTISKKDTAPKNIITDESLIPSQYWKKPPPVIDKKLINEKISEGEEIEGVERSNGGLSLTIRIA